MGLLKISLSVLLLLLVSLLCVGVFAETVDEGASAGLTESAELVVVEPNEAAFIAAVDPLGLAKQKRSAMGLLAVGLEAYLAGRLDAADEYLRKSAGYGDYATDVFYSGESVSLEGLLEICSVAGVEDACLLCGGTGLVDCTSCLGVGWYSCRECKGTGMVTEASKARDEQGRAEYSTESFVCTYCNGLTVLKCDKCKGTGVVECSEGAVRESEAISVGSADVRDAIKRVLAVALYLKSGRADVYSKGALRTVEGG